MPQQLDIPRDQWTRPRIIPLGGGELEAYTRVSTMAKALDAQNGLMAWKQRQTARGLVMRPDLITRVAGILANGDPDSDWPTKRALQEACEDAMEAAGSSKGASSGTGLHALTEAIDRGEDPQFVPAHDAPRLQAYREATAPLKALDAETFVVCDELRAAGSFDRLWFVPPGYTDSRGYVFPAPAVVVGDLKSGKSEADYPLATATQLAIYAHGKRYDPATGQRTPIDERLVPSVGLLIHMPPRGGCEVIALNLDRGWRAAQAAAFVHHHVRKWRPAELICGGA